MSLAARYATATPEQIGALEEAESSLVTLEARLRKLRADTARSLAEIKAPEDHASAELAEIARLEALATAREPSNDRTYALRALLMRRKAFEAVTTICAVQRSCDEQNLTICDEALAVIDAVREHPQAWVEAQQAGALSGRLGLKVADEDVAYQLARAQMDFFLGLGAWTACADGIDAILRATDNGQAITPTSDGEAEGRAGMAAAVQAAMAADPALEKLLRGLGAELSEAFVYFEWAAPLLQGLGDMPAEVQAQTLADPDWKRLRAHVETLTGLVDRLQPYPSVAHFFPPPREPIPALAPYAG